MKEARNCHRANAAGNGGKGTCDLHDFGIGNIADQFGLAGLGTGHSVDADIYHARAGLDPIRLHHFRATHSCHDNVSTADDLG